MGASVPSQSSEFRVPTPAIDQLFRRGFTSFSVPRELIVDKARRQQEVIAAFLAGELPGTLCVELHRDGEGDVDSCAVVERMLREHGLAPPGPPDEDAASDGFYRIEGTYDALGVFKEALLDADIALHQMWFTDEYDETDEPDAGQPDRPDPLVPFMLDVFEQIYGELDASQRARVLSDRRHHFQLYTLGCFIREHQDADEFRLYERGISLAKKCIMLCYLSEGWEAEDGGLIECVMDFERRDLGSAPYRDLDPATYASNDRLAVPPVLGNIAILDFTKFNNPHTVHPVLRDGFVRKLFGWDVVVAG